MAKYRILLEQETAFTRGYYYIEEYTETQFLFWNKTQWKAIKEYSFVELDPITNSGKHRNVRKEFEKLEDAEKYGESLLNHNKGNVVKVYE